MLFRPFEDSCDCKQRQAAIVPHAPVFCKQLRQRRTAGKSTMALRQCRFNRAPCLVGYSAYGPRVFARPFARAPVVLIRPLEDLSDRESGPLPVVSHASAFGEQPPQRRTAGKAAPPGSQSLVDCQPAFVGCSVDNLREWCGPFTGPLVIGVCPTGSFLAAMGIILLWPPSRVNHARQTLSLGQAFSTRGREKATALR
jgi:hypothetical protein